MIRSLDFFPKSGYNKRACDASVAQSVVHLTRNEKVACSSQVTSSSKTATFESKVAVFLCKKFDAWKREKRKNGEGNF